MVPSKELEGLLPKHGNSAQAGAHDMRRWARSAWPDFSVEGSGRSNSVSVFSVGSVRDPSSAHTESCKEQKEACGEDDRGEAGRPPAIEVAIEGGGHKADAPAATRLPGVTPGGLAEGDRFHALEPVPVDRGHHVVVGPALGKPRVVEGDAGDEGAIHLRVGAARACRPVDVVAGDGIPVAVEGRLPGE